MNWIFRLSTLIAFLTLITGLSASAAWVVAIGGGSASGKTTLAQAIVKDAALGQSAVHLSMDGYFRPERELPREHYIAGLPNGDHPSAVDFSLLREHLQKLKSGIPTPISIYDHLLHTSLFTVPVGPVDLIVLEGIHVFSDPAIRQLIDVGIFLDASASARRLRRIERDIRERGEQIESVQRTFDQVVQPMQVQYIDPTRRYADLVLSAESASAMATLKNQAEEYLKKRGVLRLGCQPYFTRVRK